MTDAVMALGGNVGDVRSTFDLAISALCDGVEIQLQARSSDYQTPPWGVQDQPPFINCVIVVETTITPSDLLTRSQTIEQRFGRDRAHERRWGPRTLDIDLIAYDDVTTNTPLLILPHPRLFERGFVLAPLAEISPERRIAGIAVKDAVRQVDLAGITKLPPRDGTAAAL